MKDYTYVDMHFHTKFSDGSAGIDQTIERAAKLGIGVAITDHNEYRGAEIAIKKYGKDVLIIPAMELASKEGRDLLVYFYELADLIHFQQNYIEPKRKRNPHGRIRLSLAQSLTYIRNYPAVISVAHPFGMLWKRMERMPQYQNVLAIGDAIEVLNGSLSKKGNTRARTWKHSEGKSITAGSDGHHLSGLGSALTGMPGKNHTVKSFLDGVKNKENFVTGRTMPFISQIISAVHLAKNHTKFYLPGFPKYHLAWKQRHTEALKLAPVPEEI